MQKESIIFGAFGNYGLIAAVVVLLCTGLNAFCIWMGFIGLILTVMCAIGTLLGGTEILAADGKKYHAYGILAVLLVYLFAIVVKGWFFVALGALLVLWVQMLVYKTENISLYILCVVSFVLGIECSFIIMGDDIPVNEMYVEYLAVGGVVGTWLIASIQKSIIIRRS
ncbi:MAG: hypothetical protein VZR95_00975 [Alphaproteobacteria bacterium]